MRKPRVSDERFYTTVTEELEKGAIIPGLRVKANGVDTHAQALYLKYRVAQLVQQENDARRTETEKQSLRKSQERAADLALQAARAKAEGLTSVHFILLGLLCLVFGLIIWKSCYRKER